MNKVIVFRSERLSFRAAYTFCREQGLNRKVAKAIVSQPGYRRGLEMSIARTKEGTGYRLFTRVSGQWMDASLKDLAW